MKLKVLSGGNVNTACFDKTGTLTENDLELYGVVGIHNKLMQTKAINEKTSIIFKINIIF